MWLGISGGLALLAAASLTSQAVVNLPPVVIGAKLPTLPETATAIAGAITLTRLPMFAFFPLQTTLLPRLTAGAARGDPEVGAHADPAHGRPVRCAGPVRNRGAGRRGFRAARPPPRQAGEPVQTPTLAALGIGTVFLMAVNVTQPALVALGRHRMVLVAALTGVAAMTVTFVLPVDPITSRCSRRRPARWP